MPSFAFETVDVFTERQFGGNPLAVFKDAAGMSAETMQALAFELNLSETVFVLPPADPAHTARVRIFHRTGEMPFAGHPSIGTAYVLARERHLHGPLTLELPAGLVTVKIERSASGDVIGAEITAPQPLSLGAEFDQPEIAACVGVEPEDIIVSAHRPITASTGVKFVIAEIEPRTLARCLPDIAKFRRILNERPEMNGRFSLLLYAHTDGPELRARMFAPIAGTWEDPATGSANSALAALLLHLRGGADISVVTRQGEEMRRPSLLKATARRIEDGIIATVSGRCAPVMHGHVTLN